MNNRKKSPVKPVQMWVGEGDGYGGSKLWAEEAKDRSPRRVRGICPVTIKYWANLTTNQHSFIYKCYSLVGKFWKYLLLLWPLAEQQKHPFHPYTYRVMVFLAMCVCNKSNVRKEVRFACLRLVKSGECSLRQRSDPRSVHGRTLVIEPK